MRVEKVMWRQRVLVLVAVLALGAVVVTFIVTQRSLPDRVAVHWGLSGRADSFVSPWVAWVVTGGVGGLAALLTLLMVAAGSGSRARRPLVGAGLFVAVLFSGLSVLITVANGGGGAPQLSSLGVVVVIALCLILPVILAAPPSKSGRLEWTITKPAAGVLWRGRSRSRFAIPLFLIFFVAGVAVGTWNIALGMVIALAGLTMLVFVGIQVEISRDAVRVRYSGSLRWPASRIPIDDIAQVSAIDIAPLRYGGWGYRGSLRLFGRAAVTLRRGPGLRFALRDDHVFMVTVDDPDTAVRALAPLLPTTAEPGSAPR